jgi:hypothetical protein
MGELLQKCPGARVDGLAQAMLAGKRLRRRGRQAGGACHHIRGSLIIIVVGEGAGIHAMIGDQDALKTVKDEEIGLFAEASQEPRLPLGPGQGAHNVLAVSAHIAKRADEEILEGRIAFVEAPP